MEHRTLARHCAGYLVAGMLGLVVAALDGRAQAPAPAQSPVPAQAVPPEQLVALMRKGGLVLIVRHASSPQELPTKATANADNLKLERQLDEAGRTGSIAMGQALRGLKVPIGEVVTSPAYRAMETVRLGQFGTPSLVAELGEGPEGMQGVSEAQAAFLRTRVAQKPKTGNTLIVTHNPNLTWAFPGWGSTVAQGETVVVRPDGVGIAVIGRIKIDEWPLLSAQPSPR
jgi:phosphohistidine phosphatase SixA